MSDLDDWIDGAQRTRRSVTIYQRADLVSDIDAVEARISALSGDPDAGPELDELRGQWEQLAQQFHDSARTIVVQGLTAAEIKAIEQSGDLDKKTANQIGADLLAKAIVDPVFTAEQLLRLEGRIGQPQMNRISSAFHLASRLEPPEPDFGKGPRT